MCIFTPRSYITALLGIVLALSIRDQGCGFVVNTRWRPARWEFAADLEASGQIALNSVFLQIETVIDAELQEYN